MTDINEIIRKAQSHSFADGLMELMLGVFMLISAMALELIGNPLISGVVTLGGILLTAKFFERLQMQVSVPRAGVHHQENRAWSRLWNAVTVIAIIVIVLSLFFWLLYNNPDNALTWLSLMVGTVIGLALLAQGIHLRLWRLALHGIISLGLGLLLSPIVTGADPGSGLTGLGVMSVYFFGMGISLSLAGWIVLNRFIKSHPVKREDQDG